MVSFLFIAVVTPFSKELFLEINKFQERLKKDTEGTEVEATAADENDNDFLGEVDEAEEAMEDETLEIV